MEKKAVFALVVAGAAILLIAIAYSQLGVRPAVNKPQTLDFVSLPPGFSISTFADGLGGSGVSTPGPNPGPRKMLLHEGVLFASIPTQGKVVALPDANADGIADSAITFIAGLSSPHGLAFADGWFYIAEETQVLRVKAGKENPLVADNSTLEVFVDGLPGGGHFSHWTRTIRIKDGFLYLSVGSSCNACVEEDKWRAAIHKCSLAAGECTVFARGLRNAVGIAFHPQTGELYATENARDWLGDDAPPDEINLVREGGNYGWPTCFGNNVHDADFDKNTYVRNPCMEPFETPSLVDLQAHSAPLGLAFYYGGQFPNEYLGKLFTAMHGSWNRGEPTGYKIVVVDLERKTVSDFATGWLDGQNVRGRPVDLLVAPDGSLYASDDNAGKIYRITYSA